MIMTGGLAVRAGVRTAEIKVALSCLVFAATAVTGLMAYFGFSSDAEAKTPGSTYCYYGKCHRVKTLAETEKLVGSKETLHTSFYDDCKKDSLNPCGLTSSGEVFRPHEADNAASPIYPDGTVLLVWSPVSKEAAVLRVNNAGPYWGNRKLDVSRAVADVLGFRSRGVAQLQVQVLDAPNSEQATYKRRRKYKAVPGPIGTYGSLEEARISIAVMESLDNMTVTALTAPSNVRVADVEDDGLIELAAANADAVPMSLSAPVKDGSVLGQLQAKSQRVAEVHRVATRQLAQAEQAKREELQLAEQRLQAKSIRVAHTHVIAEAQQVGMAKAQAEVPQIAKADVEDAEAKKLAAAQAQHAKVKAAKERRQALAKRRAASAKRLAVAKKKAAAKKRAVSAKRSKARSRRATASRRANRKQRYATRQRSARRAKSRQAVRRPSYDWSTARTRLHSRPLARYGAPRKTSRHSRKRGYWQMSEAQIDLPGHGLIGMDGSSLFDDVPEGARRKEPSPADHFPSDGPVQVV